MEPNYLYLFRKPRKGQIVMHKIEYKMFFAAKLIHIFEINKRFLKNQAILEQKKAVKRMKTAFKTFIFGWNIIYLVWFIGIVLHI